MTNEAYSPPFHEPKDEMNEGFIDNVTLSLSLIPPSMAMRMDGDKEEILSITSKFVPKPNSERITNLFPSKILYNKVKYAPP